MPDGRGADGAVQRTAGRGDDRGDDRALKRLAPRLVPSRAAADVGRTAHLRSRSCAGGRRRSAGSAASSGSPVKGAAASKRAARSGKSLPNCCSTAGRNGSTAPCYRRRRFGRRAIGLVRVAGRRFGRARAIIHAGRVQRLLDQGLSVREASAYWTLAGDPGPSVQPGSKTLISGCRRAPAGFTQRESLTPGGSEPTPFRAARIFLLRDRHHLRDGVLEGVEARERLTSWPRRQSTFTPPPLPGPPEGPAPCRACVGPPTRRSASHAPSRSSAPSAYRCWRRTCDDLFQIQTEVVARLVDRQVLGLRHDGKRTNDRRIDHERARTARRHRDRSPCSRRPRRRQRSPRPMRRADPWRSG